MPDRVDPQGGFFDLTGRVTQPVTSESAQMQPRGYNRLLTIRFPGSSLIPTNGGAAGATDVNYAKNNFSSGGLILYRPGAGSIQVYGTFNISPINYPQGTRILNYKVRTLQEATPANPTTVSLIESDDTGTALKTADLTCTASGSRVTDTKDVSGSNWVLNADYTYSLYVQLNSSAADAAETEVQWVSIDLQLPG